MGLRRDPLWAQMVVIFKGRLFILLPEVITENIYNEKIKLTFNQLGSSYKLDNAGIKSDDAV